MGYHLTDPEGPSVYDQIKELLVTYAFFPGDRLHVPDLADRLRVSATPVREALNRFCAEGLLTAVPHRGFFVKKLDQGEISELLEMKYVLLGHAVKGPIADLEFNDVETRMASSLAAMDRGTMEDEKALEIYERYAASLMMLIASLSGNTSLLKSLGNILDKLHFVRQTEVHMADRSQAVLRECAGIARGVLGKRRREVESCLQQQHQREQAMLPDLMKECVSRLYVRSQPVRQPSERRAQLAMLSA